MLQVPSSFVSHTPSGASASRTRRRFCVAVLVAAAFYGGFRAGVIFSGLQAQGGPLEQPGRGAGDIVQTIRYVPELQCDARAVLDARCLPLGPATQVPVTPAPVAQVSVVQVRRRKPTPPPKPAARQTQIQDEAHIGLQR